MFFFVLSCLSKLKSHVFYSCQKQCLAKVSYCSRQLLPRYMIWSHTQMLGQSFRPHVQLVRPCQLFAAICSVRIESLLYVTVLKQCLAQSALQLSFTARSFIWYNFTQDKCMFCSGLMLFPQFISSTENSCAWYLSNCNSEPQLAHSLICVVDGQSSYPSGRESYYRLSFAELG